jgi:hypothetical protein
VSPRLTPQPLTLPRPLLRKLRAKARAEGRPLAEVVADLLAVGLPGELEEAARAGLAASLRRARPVEVEAEEREPGEKEGRPSKGALPVGPLDHLSLTSLADQQPDEGLVGDATR